MRKRDSLKDRQTNRKTNGRTDKKRDRQTNEQRDKNNFFNMADEQKVNVLGKINFCNL